MVVWLLCTYTIERKLRGSYWTCCKTLTEIFLHEHCSWCWRQIERLRYICTFFFHILPPTQPARRIHGVLVGRTHVDPQSNIPSHFSQRKQRSQFFTNVYTGCSFPIATLFLKLYIANSWFGQYIVHPYFKIKVFMYIHLKICTHKKIAMCLQPRYLQSSRLVSSPTIWTGTHILATIPNCPRQIQIYCPCTIGVDMDMEWVDK